jgi:hypothetical protein
MAFKLKADGKVTLKDGKVACSCCCLPTLDTTDTAILNACLGPMNKAQAEALYFQPRSFKFTSFWGWADMYGTACDLVSRTVNGSSLDPGLGVVQENLVSLVELVATFSDPNAEGADCNASHTYAMPSPVSGSYFRVNRAEVTLFCTVSLMESGFPGPYSYSFAQLVRNGSNYYVPWTGFTLNTGHGNISLAKYNYLDDSFPIDPVYAAANGCGANWGNYNNDDGTIYGQFSSFTNDLIVDGHSSAGATSYPELYRVQTW